MTVSIILSSPSLALSLKILPISRSSTKGIESSDLIYCHLSLMPPSIASMCYTALIALILSINKIIPSCFYCVKKGLVCIIIVALSSRQPSSYTKCTKVNMYSSYNICSISNTKCIYYPTLLSRLVLCLSYYKVLDLIHC